MNSLIGAFFFLVVSVIVDENAQQEPELHTGTLARLAGAFTELSLNKTCGRNRKEKGDGG